MKGGITESERRAVSGLPSRTARGPHQRRSTRRWPPAGRTVEEWGRRFSLLAQGLKLEIGLFGQNL